VSKRLDGSRRNLAWRKASNPDIVLDGDPAPPPKEAQPFQYSAHVCCGQMAGRIKMPLGTNYEGRPRPGDIVLDGDPSPPAQKRGYGAAAPTFRPMYCGQTAGWIKMPLGMEVGLGPRHTVLDAVPQNRAQPPIFGPCLLRPNGWIDQDASWYGDRPRPRRHCVRWGPSSP